MAKKLIYIMERRHGYNYDEEMFNFRSFTKHGMVLEVWSFVYWTFSEKKPPMPTNCDKTERTHYIDNEEELTSNMQRIKDDDCYFVCYPYHAYGEISYIIRKYIKHYGFKFVNITESPSLNLVDNKCALKISLISALRIEILNLIKIFLISFLAIFILKYRKTSRLLRIRFFGPYIYKSEYNYITTEILYKSFPNKLEAFSRRNILIYSDSVDEYKKTNKQSPINKPYVVFIDQALGTTTIHKTHGLSPVYNVPTVYYEQLNRLFEKIENKYNCDVVIAEHPKGEYIGNEFGNRKIIKGKTNELINGSLFVIQQFSTCFSLQPLFKKNFLDIYTNEILDYSESYKGIYKAIREIFDCKQLNISIESNLDYIEDYITEYNQQKFSNFSERYVISSKSKYNINDTKNYFHDYIYNSFIEM